MGPRDEDAPEALSGLLSGLRLDELLGEVQDRIGEIVSTRGRMQALLDAVLVVDPQGILDEGVRGHNDLYVALTRATQRLGVLSPGPLPAALARL